MTAARKGAGGGGGKGRKNSRRRGGDGAGATGCDGEQDGRGRAGRERETERRGRQGGRKAKKEKAPATARPCSSAAAGAFAAVGRLRVKLKPSDKEGTCGRLEVEYQQAGCRRPEGARGGSRGSIWRRFEGGSGGEGRGTMTLVSRSEGRWATEVAGVNGRYEHRRPGAPALAKLGRLFMAVLRGTGCLALAPSSPVLALRP